jgi:hypothetical protein
VFAAAAGWIGSLLIQPRPFGERDLDELHRLCAARGIAVLHSPRAVSRDLTATVLRARDLAAVHAASPVDIRPVYDDRPFFFYSVKPEQVADVLTLRGSTNLVSFGSVTLLALLGIVLALVLAAIVVPLLARGIASGSRALSPPGRPRTAAKLRDLSYFVCIGVGYILVEIALLSRFSLYLGHPTHSLRVVFFSLLLASGVGSLLSGRAGERALRTLLVAAGGGTVALVLAISLASAPLLEATMGWSLGARAALATALCAAPGLLMGMMLPTGMRLVGAYHAELIPWAWGLNGAASVLGSVAAMTLAIHVGFARTFLVGGCMYLFAVVAGLRLRAT